MNVVQKLQMFKDWVREGLLSDASHFKIKNYEKVFSFENFCYENKSRQSVTVGMASIKMMVRVLEIIQIVLELFKKDQSITKRNLYYKLINYYSSRYNLVSIDLQLICMNLSITRDQLRIVTSSRCLVFGRLSIKNQQDNVLCSPQFITNISTHLNQFQIETCCKVLLIVEKQSALYQIHQRLIKRLDGGQPAQKNIIQSTIVLASKGYPDLTTRKLIQSLLPLVEQIFYLGDSDIYGLDILLSYVIVNAEWTSYLQRAKWLQISQLVDMQQIQKELQAQSKQDRIKSIQMLQRPYFKNIEIFIPNTSKKQLCKAKLITWKQQLKSMQLSDTKLQLQSLLKLIPDNWLQMILSEKHYL